MPDHHSPPRRPPSPPSQQHQQRNPFLPTRAELFLVAFFPCLLVFGTIFALLSPETRAVPHDRASAAYPPNLAPSYFARKDNLLNVLFVKRGWAWISGVFGLWVWTSPALAATTKNTRGEEGGNAAGLRRARAVVRWAMVTGWWILVTQWCFGPPIVDRSFRWTGGKCEAAERELGMGDVEVGMKEVFTAAACRAAGGKWRGGHDISGHVFLLVLGSVFLVQEVGWATARWAGWLAEERCVVMHDGAVKSANVEASGAGGRVDGPAPSVSEALGLGGRAVAVVVGLSVWMLLMTAIYFHTWFEKFTGLLFALAGLYATYILPRCIPALRRVVGLPGI
ncbi:hypothetical protein VTJ04DRAFT_3968 [Mycothermus thermophilus]|uniref:uncharacterized protein n=1 Tax=Humicola insolens TaxID=85995 RepID=UPI003743F8AD